MDQGISGARNHTTGQFFNTICLFSNGLGGCDLDVLRSRRGQRDKGGAIDGDRRGSAVLAGNVQQNLVVGSSDDL